MLTHLIVASDVDRTRRFYAGEVLREGVEWVAIPRPDRQRWTTLLAEARSFAEAPPATGS